MEGFWNMLVGYMRVSSDSDRQTTDLQKDALLAAGVDERHLFEDKASGARSDRSGLAAALDYVRTGDCLVVWKLDRLGRSLPHLLEIVTGLEAREVGFRSLTEQMDTTTPHGAFLFSVFGALAQYERALARGADHGRPGGSQETRPAGRAPTGHRSRKAGGDPVGTRKRRQQGRGMPQLRRQTDDALSRVGAV